MKTKAVEMTMTTTAAAAATTTTTGNDPVVTTETETFPPEPTTNRGKESWLQVFLELLFYPSILLASLAYQVHRMYKSRNVINLGGVGNSSQYHQVSSKDDTTTRTTLEAEMTELSSGAIRNNNNRPASVVAVDAEYGELGMDDNDDDDDDDIDAFEDACQSSSELESSPHEPASSDL
jgi:hypothetical protein